MDCKHFEEQLSEYIDGKLESGEKILFENHLASCEKCQEQYRYIVNMINDLGQLPPLESPVDINQDILEYIIKNKKDKKRIFLSTKKIIPYAAVFILGIFVMYIGNSFITSMGGGFISSNDMATEESANSQSYDYDMLGSADGGSDLDRNESIDENKEITENTNTSLSEVFDKEKIIYEGTLNLNVEDVQSTTKEITTYIEKEKGFIQNAYMSNNDISEYYGQSYITVRVPSDKFKGMLENLKAYGEETNSNFNATNITTEYRNLQSELESYQIQEERLLSYLKEAEKMQDMLTIESELNRVRTNINILNTQLKNYDQMVSYSTITIYLTESNTMSTSIQSPFGSLLSNISKGFISSFNSLLKVISTLIVWFFKIIPFLIIIIPVGLLLRRFINRRK